jgi:excisionase family DNA binding protein
MKKKFITTTELAKRLGISRIAVFKRIKKGKIDVVKFGRDYLIYERDVKKIPVKKLKSHAKTF